MKETDNLEDLGVDGQITLKCIIEKLHDTAWTGLICLKVGRSGGLF